MPILYGHPYSYSSRKVHWALEEIGLDYEYRQVDLRAGEHKQPAFTTLNPNARLPVLQDEEAVLFESNAILSYLARKHGQLEGRGLRGYGETHQWLSWETSDLIPVSKAWYAKFLVARGVPLDEPAYAAAVEAAKRPLAILDNHLTKYAFLVDKTFSVADIAIAEVLSLCETAEITLSGYDAVQRWLREVTGRPAFAKTRPS